MSKIHQLKEVPGVLSCVFTHEVSKTTHKFTWNGPKLNAIWPQVLAFFKWTYDTMHSESQVRLFVNGRTNEWAAWAFPQKAKTGMNAHELRQGEDGYERSEQQRAQFSDTDGWLYWGTVHHHCSSPAFQSGTDSNNEESQDGLHITVGELNKSTMSIHYRIYQSGTKLGDIPLSTFWDVGTIIDQVPEQFRHLMRPNIKEELVLLQMGTHAPADTVIPQQWKDNVIDCTPKQLTVISSGTPSQGSFYQGVGGQWNGGVFIGKKPFTERAKYNYASDLEKAVKETIHHCVEKQVKIHDVAYWFEQMASMWDDEVLDMLDICMRNDVTPDNFLRYLKQEISVATRKGGKKGNGKGKKELETDAVEVRDPLTDDQQKQLNEWERHYYGGVHGGEL